MHRKVAPPVVFLPSLGMPCNIVSATPRPEWKMSKINAVSTKAAKRKRLMVHQVESPSFAGSTEVKKCRM